MDRALHSLRFSYTGHLSCAGEVASPLAPPSHTYPKFWLCTSSVGGYPHRELVSWGARQASFCVYLWYEEYYLRAFPRLWRCGGALPILHERGGLLCPR